MFLAKVEAAIIKFTKSKKKQPKARSAVGKEEQVQLTGMKYLKSVQIPEGMDPFTSCDSALISKIVTAFFLDIKVLPNNRKAEFIKFLAKKLRRA